MSCKSIELISKEAAKLLYDRMYELGRVKTEPWNRFNWSVHPQQFLPSNVCCDFEGNAKFLQLLKNTISETIIKHLDILNNDLKENSVSSLKVMVYK
jgi:hypothetical protein